VDGAVGEREVAGRLAEEVERKRWRPQEVRPQPLMIEALVRLDEGRSRPRRGEGAGGDEVRAGLARVGERQPAPDGRTVPPGRGAIGCDPIGCPFFSRPRLLLTQPATELGHLRPTRHAVVRFPAVGGLKLPPRRSVTHAFARSRARVWSATPRRLRR